MKIIYLFGKKFYVYSEEEFRQTQKESIERAADQDVYRIGTGCDMFVIEKSAEEIELALRSLSDDAKIEEIYVSVMQAGQKDVEQCLAKIIGYRNYMMYVVKEIIARSKPYCS